MKYTIVAVLATFCLHILDANAQTRGMQQVIEDPETGRFIQPYEDSWAIIIGIDRYQHVPRLDYAVADARAIERMLINSFGFERDNITVLTNEEATQRSIRRAFGSLYDVGQDDRVLIFFAGHGETIDLAAGGNMGFLIPYEGKARAPQDLYETSISMQTIRELAGYIPAKHVLFLIDACYGGLAAEGVRSLSRDTQGYIRKIVADRARQIITAGGRGEQVVERPEWGHSAFTYTLLNGLEKGLADLDNDGIITANELATYLRRQVSRVTNNRQTPQFRAFTHDEGEFLFIRSDITKITEPTIRYGNLLIHTNPEGAEVKLNGDLLQRTTPVEIERLEVGEYFVEVRKGDLHANSDVVIEPERVNRITLTLTAESTIRYGDLMVGTVPEGAKVKLNGDLLQRTTPVAIERLKVGEYFVEVRKGNLYANSNIVVDPDRVNRITLNLDRIIEDGTDIVTDIDNNEYNVVKIGTQYWLAENLRVTRYRNGDPILNIDNNSEWGKLNVGAWAYYNNDSSKSDSFGKLYNWYAVDDPRGLCPIGWRVPTENEWTQLEGYLGGSRDARLKMASTKTQYWNRTITNASNESGFSGLPAGNRSYDGNFNNIGNYGYWWSSTEQNVSTAMGVSLGYYSSTINRMNSFKESGFSVRCVKDYTW